jgi:hypothetical protein
VFEEEGGSNGASLLVLILFIYLFIYFNYLPFQNIYITRESERRAGPREKKKKEKER